MLVKLPNSLTPGAWPEACCGVRLQAASSDLNHLHSPERREGGGLVLSSFQKVLASLGHGGTRHISFLLSQIGLLRILCLCLGAQFRRQMAPSLPRVQIQASLISTFPEKSTPFSSEVGFMLLSWKINSQYMNQIRFPEPILDWCSFTEKGPLSPLLSSHFLSTMTELFTKQIFASHAFHSARS